MHHVVLAPSNQPPLKPLRLAYARHVLEEIVPSFQALPKDQRLDDPVGIFGTAARFSYVLDGLLVWNLNALSIDANWHALERWREAPDFGVGATRGWVGGLV
jgi:hypothetical protein